MKSTYILKSIVVTSILLVVIIYFKYRAPAFPLGFQALESLVSAVILAVTAIFLWKIRFKWLTNIQNNNVKPGLYFGLLWTVEIGINNIVRPGLPMRDIVDNTFWVTIALLILITAIYYAWKSKKISQGIISGFWSGLASGAVACITALLLIVFGMTFILNDPLNIKEWSDVKATVKIPDMAVYFAYQTLAGAIMHLVILGAIMGIILGFIGGITGKTLSLLRK
jgi:phosphate starvation-inducible membrane PsiE